jgi:hypothetical protein
VEELLEFMGADALGMTDEQQSVDQETETLCSISLQALSDRVIEKEGIPSVLQLQGWLQGNLVTMLVDSGSTVSFVNKSLLPFLQGVTPVLKPVRVKVANDRELSCTDEILQCSWVTQGHEFNTDFKLLQLGAFDVIPGQDWLYKHSPMNIDWPTKRLQISADGLDVYLQGIGARSMIC